MSLVLILDNQGLIERQSRGAGDGSGDYLGRLVTLCRLGGVHRATTGREGAAQYCRVMKARQGGFFGSPGAGLRRLPVRHRRGRETPGTGRNLGTGGGAARCISTASQA